MNILGLSCHYHDSAACLVQDGNVVAAVQEERFDRVKASAAFPIHAINYCMHAGGIDFHDIDHVVFYEKPYLKLARVLVDHLRSYPQSFTNFVKGMPEWLKDRLILPLLISDETGVEKPVLFLKHHLSHAASAFLCSPFDQAAILTADGVGEWTTMTWGTGSHVDIDVRAELTYPDSLGLVYSAITSYLGFRPNLDEGTVMGLAGCGEPVYLSQLKNMVKMAADGSFRIDPSFFGFIKGSRMYSRKFVKTFGPPRMPDEAIVEHHCNMASSLQGLVEDILIHIGRHVHAQTKEKHLCLAGGLFLNCVANHRILEETPFEDVFIQPASGDAGGALGAALYVQHSMLKTPRQYTMRDAYLGPEYSDDEIGRALASKGIRSDVMDEEQLCRRVAEELSRSKVIGWFQGRMEFGPRALGNRTILGNPCNPKTKDIINARVKKREAFRPYAPIVLAEHADTYFELAADSPFMLLAPRVREEMRAAIPSAVHVDGTARVQTLTRQQNPRLHRVISYFAETSGAPMVLNTSFNLRGEPVVCSPLDAIRSFSASEMDVLVLGRHFISRHPSE